MSYFSRKLLILPALFAVATSAFAGDRQAVLIANRSYDTLRDVYDASDALNLSQDLRRAGFDVTAFSNLDSDEMREGLARIEAALKGGSELLVFVSGQVSTVGDAMWLMATDAGQPSALMPGHNALSVNALAQAMSDTGASAVLLVGEATGAFDAPQGVAVFTGPTDDLASLARSGLLDEVRSLASVAATAPRDVSASGYLPSARAFLASDSETVVSALPEGVTEADIEAMLFEKAIEANTEAALEGFLDRYPTGVNASKARTLLANLSKSPVDLARDAENALSLSRTSRRTIQSNLTLLGFDTNGVDGILGRGSRRAISQWQAANDLPITSYLNADQISAMEAQAFVERQEQEREDAEYWRQTGRMETESGYRAYLARYPEGLFADFARQKLDEIETERLQSEGAAEIRAWTDAINLNTAEAYRSFLESYPNSQFANEARARLAVFEPAGPSQEQIDLARSQEEKAMVNAFLRILSEQRLAALGYNPGKIDGGFDENTRVAIKAFQEAHDIPATGYLGGATITRLLNDGG